MAHVHKMTNAVIDLPEGVTPRLTKRRILRFGNLSNTNVLYSSRTRDESAKEISPNDLSSLMNYPRNPRN